MKDVHHQEPEHLREALDESYRLLKRILEYAEFDNQKEIKKWVANYEKDYPVKKKKQHL